MQYFLKKSSFEERASQTKAHISELERFNAVFSEIVKIQQSAVKKTMKLIEKESPFENSFFQGIYNIFGRAVKTSLIDQTEMLNCFESEIYRKNIKFVAEQQLMLKNILKMAKEKEKKLTESTSKVLKIRKDFDYRLDKLINGRKQLLGSNYSFELADQLETMEATLDKQFPIYKENLVKAEMSRLAYVEFLNCSAKDLKNVRDRSETELTNSVMKFQGFSNAFFKKNEYSLQEMMSALNEMLVQKEAEPVSEEKLGSEPSMIVFTDVPLDNIPTSIQEDLSEKYTTCFKPFSSVND